MTKILFHHYPQSPVAEKVRVILGIKSLDWHSVEIPRLPPKPDLIPLTGGYRRTPVMQIGSDIYCDSQCIIQELETRFPNPSIHHGSLEWGLSRWIEGPMFTQAITVVLGAAENLPAQFAADRGRLYFGSDFDLSTVQAAVDHSVAQLRGQFDWFEKQLSSGTDFIMGAQPGLIDALTYHLVWFLRGRWSLGPQFFDEFRLLTKWEQRIQSIGHGQSTAMDSNEALNVAAHCEPQTQPFCDDFAQYPLGTLVGVTPEGDGGDPVVKGNLVVLSSNRIALARTDDQVGNVVVHFPRIGYRIGGI